MADGERPPHPNDRVKLTIKGTRAMIANFYDLEREVIEGLEDAVTVGAGAAVRHIRQTAVRDTGYMATHAKSKISPNRRRFEAGWWKEDFVGQYNSMGRYNPERGNTPRFITVFYPVWIEEGFWDKQGRWHPARPVLPGAYNLGAKLVIQATTEAIKGATRKQRKLE